MYNTAYVHVHVIISFVLLLLSEDVLCIKFQSVGFLFLIAYQHNKMNHTEPIMKPRLLITVTLSVEDKSKITHCKRVKATLSVLMFTSLKLHINLTNHQKLKIHTNMIT